jgi:hypothetical protein
VHDVVDSGTITISDTATTSFDSFTGSDNHDATSSISTSNTTGTTTTVTYQDSGVDQDGMYAKGTESSSGDVYSFTNTESSNDNFVLTPRRSSGDQLAKLLGAGPNRKAMMFAACPLENLLANRAHRFAIERSLEYVGHHWFTEQLQRYGATVQCLGDTGP